MRQLQTGALSRLVKNLPDGRKDKSECEQFIKTMILNLNQYFGVTWSDFQIKETAKDFYSRYFYWHIADYKKFMGNCRAMDYGKMYVFNNQTLMLWAQEYDSEWLTISQQIAFNKHDQRKRSEERTRETTIKQLKEVNEKFSKFAADYAIEQMKKEKKK